jgi:hypothetical protein
MREILERLSVTHGKRSSIALNTQGNRVRLSTVEGFASFGSLQVLLLFWQGITAQSRSA